MDSQGIDKAADEVIYTVLGYNDLESSRAPLSPNSLSFSDKELNARFDEKIMGAANGSSEVSVTFKNNLVFFTVTMILFCITSVVSHTVTHYRNDHLSARDLQVHLVCLMVILALGLAIFGAVMLSLPIRLLMKKVYLCYMCLVVLYLILGDERVLASVTESQYYESHSNYPMALLLFLYLYSVVSFSYFIGVLIISGYALGLYLGLMLAKSPYDQVVTTADFLYLTFFCAILCFRTHQTEHRARNLFWRMKREEDVGVTYSKGLRKTSNNGLDTEAEKVLELCDNIREKIKSAASVVIFKDIKSQLKEAMSEIDKVKAKLARGNLNEIDRFSQLRSIDEEDKKFIYHHFYNTRNSFQSTGKLRRVDRKASQVFYTEFGTSAEALSGMLSMIATSWDFDIWEPFDKTSHSVMLVGKHLLVKWDLLPILKIEEVVADKFFLELEQMYLRNPYHNACHAADVCHTLFFFLERSTLFKQLSGIELAACVIAALGHDVGHPGLTNRFLVNTREKIAMRYNDMSVLENMHISKVYKIMKDPTRNVLISLPQEDWLLVRKMTVEMILSTDMSKHFEALGQFRARTHSGTDLNLELNDDKTFVVSMGLKCADLGHSAKSLSLHLKWTDLIFEEFFAQGDLERSKAVPISMGCDRETTDLPKSQAGFLKNICLPLFEPWADYLSSSEINEKCMTQLRDNVAMWEERMKGGKSTAMLDSVPRSGVESRRTSLQIPPVDGKLSAALANNQG